MLPRREKYSHDGNVIRPPQAVSSLLYRREFASFLSLCNHEKQKTVSLKAVRCCPGGEHSPDKFLKRFQQ